LSRPEPRAPGDTCSRARLEVPVSVVRSAGSYPVEAPYGPGSAFPEYRFGPGSLSGDNAVYEAVRSSFAALGLDRERFGTPEWDPLGGIVRPGDSVLVKPNAVFHRNLSGGDPYAVVTHPSVIRAVTDYVLIALQGRGRVTIGDAPQFDSDFGRYLDLTGLDQVVRFYKAMPGPEVSLVDLRKLVVRFDETRGIVPVAGRTEQQGDPAGYAVIDLDGSSMLGGLSGIERLYGADYDRKFTVLHHSGGRHEYCVSRTALEADVIISLPKLKTHRKVGITLNIKGLVGLNGDKNYLAHYRLGCPSGGGDEYPDSVSSPRIAARSAMRKASDILLAPKIRLLEKAYVALDRIRIAAGRAARSLGMVRPMPEGSDRISCGDWSGNDTAWRMAVDLLRIALCADSGGHLSQARIRRFFSVVDGIVAGEGEGPLSPAPRRDMVLVAGADPVAVDAACARLMGLDPGKLPILSPFSGGGAEWSGHPGFECIRIAGLDGRSVGLEGLEPLLPLFRLPFGWGRTAPGQP
jgi:uncharacterized protein (DUF362 family)